MTTPAGEQRVALIAAIMRGLKAYAPDEVEMYGHDEAEMIADYVEPYIQARLRAVEEAMQELLTMAEMDKQKLRAVEAERDEAWAELDGAVDRAQTRLEERDAAQAEAQQWKQTVDGMDKALDAAREETEHYEAEARRLREALEGAEEFLHTLRLATTKDEVWALVSPSGGWPEQVHAKINAALTPTEAQ